MPGRFRPRTTAGSEAASHTPSSSPTTSATGSTNSATAFGWGPIKPTDHPGVADHARAVC
ncbi:Uncharacterised protein [Mycobacterium tuberculosis]|nr:hypothetical protein IQ44_13390 [Mycobacterium tuberculosis]EQM16513.1 hypothetical protein FJ05194_4160 [Mycobacterium tuberculosis FJ05194]AIH49713.1 hypothetical protein IQ39_13170 [Mycobacterium tuberculosis]CEZ60625.1 Uncharacterised protein [Mycobacterium tuberculosis]CEZ96014.1 Uncharacterised protein [Mycobacterium tuberculosis]